jgi:hypothetical protein
MTAFINAVAVATAFSVEGLVRMGVSGMVPGVWAGQGGEKMVEAARVKTMYGWKLFMCY